MPTCVTWSPCSSSGTRRHWPRTGTRSAWSAATPTPGAQGAVRGRPGAARSPRRRVGRRPAGRRTTRCCSRRCTGSPRPRRRAASCTTCVRAGCALLTAHTNADAPADGVSESLALRARPDATSRRWCPRRPSRSTSSSCSCRSADADAVRAALAEAGAGRIGDYDSAPSPPRARDGSGRSRAPAPRSARSASSRWSTRSGSRWCCPARPARRSSLRCARRTPTRSRRTTSSSSPTPASRPRGHGRIGTLAAPTTLRGFAEQVAAALPGTAHGVRVAGDPDRPVGTVAVCGGRGRLPARRGASAPTRTSTSPPTCATTRRRSSSSTGGGPALVDVAHWAAEWTWLPVVRAQAGRERWAIRWRPA